MFVGSEEEVREKKWVIDAALKWKIPPRAIKYSHRRDIRV